MTQEGHVSKFLNRTLAIAWNSLGACPTCLRMAFRTAMIAWALVAICSILGAGSAVLTTAYMGATGLTILWLMHLLVFSKKVTVATTLRPESISSSRRATLHYFPRALAFAAFVSAAPKQALAQSYGCCSCEGCPPCYRPINGGRDGCIKCHSCDNGQGIFNCGGQTC